MQAVPDEDKYKKRPKPRKTRYEKLLAFNPEKTKLPDIDGAHYIAEWLYEAGIYDEGDNGPKTLSWQTLAAWQQATGTKAAPDDLAIMRKISRDYVAEYYASDDPMRPAPTFDAEKIDHDGLSDALDSAFDRLFDD